MDWHHYYLYKFHAAQKMRFSIKDFLSKCDHICRKLLIRSHLLKKFLIENFMICTVPEYEDKGIN